MKTTTNLGLVKPDLNDKFSLEHLNNNWEKIDASIARKIENADGVIAKSQLSSDLRTEIEGKYDASNAESGRGEFTYDESINLTDKTFYYQRVGKIVTVTVKVEAGENIAANTLTLSGLPYVNKVTGIYLKILSTKNNDISVQIPYTTGQMKVVSALASGEALVFTFSYQISF